MSEPMATPPLSVEEYRVEVERALANAIIQKAEVNSKGYCWYGDCNGLSTALRFLGGYGDISFNEEWAKAALARLGDKSDYGTCWMFYPGGRYDITEFGPPGIAEDGEIDPNTAYARNWIAEATAEQERVAANIAAHKARCAVRAA